MKGDIDQLADVGHTLLPLHKSIPAVVNINYRAFVA